LKLLGARRRRHEVAVPACTTITLGSTDSAGPAMPTVWE
jgi:hypothetical protein